MKRGSITIYLALVFAVILAMLMMLFTGARDSVIRMKTECAMDASLYSVFAEYNRQLLKQYDLLFIDTSYGGGQGKPANCAEHLRYYMNQNFKPDTGLVFGDAKDLLALTAANAEIMDYSLATDGQGMVLERQAVDYIRDLYGINCLEKIQDCLESAKENQFLTRDVSKEQNDNQAQIDGMELPKRQISEEEWEEVPLDNPADAVNGARGIGILSFVLDGEQELSSQAVALSNYVSHRKCAKGSGTGERDKVSRLQRILFDRYILEKADCYTSENPDGLLHYQLEYIFAGKASDRENLEAVAQKLLFIRQAANITYLFSDAAKVAEAEALALSLTAVSMAPEFAEPVKLSILLAWAYAESVYDIKHLLSGGKIPLVKTSASWHFSLSQMLQFRQELANDTAEGAYEEGLSYEEYISMLLLTQSHEDKVMRMMDLIEMDIRNTGDNRNFRLDACVDYLKAQVVVESKYGYGCEITRHYYYY